MVFVPKVMFNRLSERTVEFSVQLPARSESCICGKLARDCPRCITRIIELREHEVPVVKQTGPVIRPIWKHSRFVSIAVEPFDFVEGCGSSVVRQRGDRIVRSDNSEQVTGARIRRKEKVAVIQEHPLGIRSNEVSNRCRVRRRLDFAPSEKVEGLGKDRQQVPCDE